MTAPRLSVVVVNWNGGDEVLGNVDALLALARRRGDVEVVVVDNGSTDGSAGRLASRDGLRLLPMGENAGFGPACNRGAGESSAPLVLFLNPDAAPRPGDDPFAPLLAAADGDAARDGFAPILEDADDSGRREPQGSFQFRRLPTLASLAREMLLVDRLLPSSPARRRERYLDVDRAAPFEVEQPAAAALAIRRETFLALGGFDPRFVPAWWEDVDLAVRLAAAGKRVVTVPPSRFVHRGGSAIGDGEAGRLSEREYRRIYGRNLVRFAAKHWGGAGSLAVRGLLFAGGAMRLLLALAGARGDRPRRVTRDAALGTIASAFARTGGGR